MARFDQPGAQGHRAGGARGEGALGLISGPALASFSLRDLQCGPERNPQCERDHQVLPSAGSPAFLPNGVLSGLAFCSEGRATAVTLSRSLRGHERDAAGGGACCP